MGVLEEDQLPATAQVQLPALEEVASSAPAKDLSKVEVATSPAERSPAAAEAAPMPAAPAPPFRADAALRQCWVQWTAVVEAFARGGNPRVDERGYRTLRALLLARCQAAPGAARPAVLQRLEAVVEPWLTPQALASIDQDTLASLLARCRELDRDLGAGRGSGRWGTLAVLACLVISAAAGWYLTRLPSWSFNVRQPVESVRCLLNSNPLLCVALCSPLLALTAVLVLPRLLRR